MVNKEDLTNSNNLLNKKKTELETQLKEKEEILRKLKLVKKFKSRVKF